MGGFLRRNVVRLDGRGSKRVSHCQEQCEQGLMHPPVGPAWLVWLELSGLGEAMRRSAWMYPIVGISTSPAS